MANSPATNITRMNLTVAASGVIQFKVEGYSFTKEDVKSDRGYYQSEAFRVGGFDWAVRYYPSKGGPGKYEVALAVLSRSAGGLGVRFTSTLLCKSGTPSVEMKAVAATTNVPYNYCPIRGTIVLSVVFPHESMAEFVVEDSFVLHCTVSVLKKPVAPF
ncbi:unnamed protein product [Urochloa decumbens]|uniref:MATH domain-containing protein n=1 Tax=Urochloa decumbens TaxID=240449 RepID=A0ABC9AE24_9POAL